ncbi:peptidase [Virgibacillus sp. W0430]|uniref:peptidase n=1 Tax=Virgibacillus sp. W0430 TaxID=3391580 RepID=UPI003F44DA65
MTKQAQISNWIEKNKQASVDFLQRMVQIPSVQGNEKKVQELVVDKLTELGFLVDIWELDGEQLKKHPYFYSSREAFEGSPNVVGILKGSGKGRSIVLNGHVDVVPEGEEMQWKHAPYSGEIINGKMYGRGTTDMKGGNMSLLIAIEAIRSLNIQLKGDVIFQSVVEEESGGAGTLAALLKGYTADAAIIPEPTNMRLFPKQPGSKWFRLIVKGRTAHGGTPYLGVSAIEKSIPVINHIKQLETVRNKRIDDPLYDKVPIPVPINIGRIEGGDWPSSVPDVVKLEGRIGIAPNEQVEDVQKELENWIEQLKEIDPWFTECPVKVEWYGARWIPGEIANDHPLMNVLKKNYTAITNEQPIIEACPWGTDGGLLTRVGNTPSIVFGPGVTDVAHYPNEYIELEKIFEAAEIIACTIIDWCNFDK